MTSSLQIANTVIQKYMAVHDDVADRIAFGLPSSLALYGLLRLSEMAAGIDQYAAVDKKIASMLLTGPAQPLDWPHERMGGLAGAYRFYQGGYKLGSTSTNPLTEIAQALCTETETLAPHQVNAETLLSICPTLAMAAVVLHRHDLHDAAVGLFLKVSERLQDPTTGLYLHALSPDGRPLAGSTLCHANGSAAAALVEILRYLPYTHPQRAALIARLQDLLAQLVALQTPNGLWRQILTEPETMEETSGSALIAYALFSTCAQPGWAAGELQTAAPAAWAGLSGQINLNSNGNINGVCPPLQPGAQLQAYRAQPESLNDLVGFGPLLLAAAAYAWLQRSQTWQMMPAQPPAFATPSNAAVEQYFSGVFATCEQNHNPDGSYYHGTSGDPEITFSEIIKESRTEHPIPRDTAHTVIGCLEMVRYAPQAIYLERARAGLDWLVREQEPDGCYRLWTRKKEGQVPHHGCLFETGIAGSALVMGYERFKDERYLAASKRAARWAMHWPVDRNVNYNAFVIWHMAEHYRITNDEAILNSAIYKTKQAMITPQQASGGWTGHNAWIWYHGINIRAYAALLQALPEQHPFRPELETALRASLGYCYQLQMPNGAVHPNPSITDKPSHLMFEIITGLVAAWHALHDDAIRASLNGLVAYRITPDSGDPEKLYNNEKDYWLYGCSPWYVYALGSYLGSVAAPEKP